MVKGEDIYSAGFAMPMYDISTEKQHFRWREEEYTLRMGSVQMHPFAGVKFKVAKIEDVRREWRLQMTA